MGLPLVGVRGWCVDRHDVGKAMIKDALCLTDGEVKTLIKFHLNEISSQALVWFSNENVDRMRKKDWEMAYKYISDCAMRIRELVGE